MYILLKFICNFCILWHSPLLYFQLKHVTFFWFGVRLYGSIKYVLYIKFGIMVRKYQRKRGSCPYLTGYTDAALKEAVNIF